MFQAHSAVDTPNDITITPTVTILGVLSQQVNSGNSASCNSSEVSGSTALLNDTSLPEETSMFSLGISLGYPWHLMYHLVI